MKLSLICKIVKIFKIFKIVIGFFSIYLKNYLKYQNTRMFYTKFMIFYDKNTSI